MTTMTSTYATKRSDERSFVLCWNGIVLTQGQPHQ